MHLKKIFITFATACVLTACGADSVSQTSTKGTGTYPNSVYVSKQSKSLESAVFGAPTSKVNLKLFTDYQCPACINFHKTIEDRLWKEYILTNKITATFYNYPLTLSTASGKPLHANAEGDALAGLCALSQGKFKDFRDSMYSLEDTKKGAITTDAERIDLAQKVGITSMEFGTCLSEAWYQKVLESEIVE